MADVFEKLKSSVNRGITTISVKGSSVLEKTKIKTHIETLNREIDRERNIAGGKAYDLWVENATDFSSVFEHFETMKAKYDEINALNEELTLIDEKENQILGNNNERVETVNTVQKIFCTQCGAQSDANVKFCTKCGNKMAE